LAAGGEKAEQESGTARCDTGQADEHGGGSQPADQGALVPRTNLLTDEEETTNSAIEQRFELEGQGVQGRSGH
jgi:hypothetical protein